jgi:hypothetical protein
MRAHQNTTQSKNESKQLTKNKEKKTLKKRTLGIAKEMENQ